ncbi:hypothetical protein TruAng_009226 [Truncatella angustata]|nr:hypothetical protein TruAng_009226 [Truncatella angustata]
MKSPTLLALAALGTYPGLTAAQLYSYFTSVITECAEATDAHPTQAYPTEAPQFSHGSVAYSMPSCDCGCKTCTYTSIYTTSYHLLCPTGVTPQEYIITETYAGAPAIPTFAEPTTLPYGFTTIDATCTICGEEPITTVITCPSGGATYVASATDAHNGLAPVYPTAVSNDTGAHPAASGYQSTHSSEADGAHPVATSIADAAGTGYEDETASGTSTITKTLAESAVTPGYHASQSTQASSPESYPVGHSSANAAQSTKPVTVSAASQTFTLSIYSLLAIGSIVAFV